jgi:hypothetical protein
VLSNRKIMVRQNHPRRHHLIHPKLATADHCLERFDALLDIVDLVLPHPTPPGVAYRPGGVVVVAIQVCGAEERGSRGFMRDDAVE